MDPDADAGGAPASSSAKVYVARFGPRGEVVAGGEGSAPFVRVLAASGSASPGGLLRSVSVPSPVHGVAVFEDPASLASGDEALSIVAACRTEVVRA